MARWSATASRVPYSGVCTSSTRSSSRKSCAQARERRFLPESALAFPCDFPIKIMGRKERGFAQTMTGIVLKHAPDFDVASVQMRPSRQGKYLSITCVVRAVSRQQLDSLYQELCDHPSVVRVF